MDNQDNNENTSAIPEEINVGPENVTNEQTNQENVVTTKFKSLNQTVTSNGNQQQTTYGIYTYIYKYK